MSLALTAGHGLEREAPFRWSQYRTPVTGLWLCGAGTHPGLGLTGGSGANAARAILRAG